MRHWRRGWPSLRSSWACRRRRPTIPACHRRRGRSRREPQRPRRRPSRIGVRTVRCTPTQPRSAVLAATCKGCGADVSGMTQIVCEEYDRVEIPRIAPDVTRGSLHGGVCPCCSKRFKAEPPAGLEPGSPFGPNLRAFVIYLRSVQGLPLARLCTVLADLFGLAISEGALVNILDASRKAFSAQTC